MALRCVGRLTLACESPNGATARTPPGSEAAASIGACAAGAGRGRRETVLLLLLLVVLHGRFGN